MTPRVMIVEDEEPLSLMLRYNLEAEGYAVETVERGDEAETRLRETVPDLLLLDWMLPGISGIELCRRLRSRDATRALPIIMLTARGEESERVRGLATCADPSPTSLPRSSRPVTSNSTAIPIAFAATAASSISGRPNSGCSNS